LAKGLVKWAFLILVSERRFAFALSCLIRRLGYAEAGFVCISVLVAAASVGTGYVGRRETMMARRFIAVVLIGLVVALVPTVSAFAKASTTTTITRMPFGFTPLLNPCTGETLDITGTVQVLTHTTFDSWAVSHQVSLQLAGRERRQPDDRYNVPAP
jgi:hypothetical protein